MKKLFEQIIKFGIVGGLCFVIDFSLTMIVSKIMRSMGMNLSDAAIFGAFWGFVVSVIANYLLSMKFVFNRRDDLDRKKEFIIFLALSIVGLGINELIIFLSIDVLYQNWAWLKSTFVNYDLVTAAAKIVATAVVMVYNFISRKVFLDKKE